MDDVVIRNVTQKKTVQGVGDESWDVRQRRGSVGLTTDPAVTSA